MRIVPAALLGLSLFALPISSCNAASEPADRGKAEGATAEPRLSMKDLGTFDEPWAMDFEPGTGNLFITERGGTLKFVQPNGRVGTVTGLPEVAYGGQGGLGDIVFAPDYATNQHVYLSWAEPGPGDTRGAAVGRARLVCEDHDSCTLQNMEVIWRQQPKTTGQGHYSHRLAFSPDGQYLFIASGDRQKLEPAQDLGNTLGTIVRLLPDGTPAPGNPFAERGGVAAEIWSYGHRNILGLDFDPQGRLWALEHGPRGGDEFNLVERGANYGWPIVSNGRHYSGGSIPDHSTRPEFAAPAVSWTPVIAPGGFMFYTGDMFPAWRGQAIMAGLVCQCLVRVAIDGESAREVGRIPMGKRIRDVAQGPDGALYVLEDEEGARLRRLTPG